MTARYGYIAEKHRAQVCVGESVKIKRVSSPLSELWGCDSEGRGPSGAPLVPMETRDKITDCCFFSFSIDPPKDKYGFCLDARGAASLHRAVRVKSQREQRLVKAAVSCSRTLEQRAGSLCEPPAATQPHSVHKQPGTAVPRSNRMTFLVLKMEKKGLVTQLRQLVMKQTIRLDWASANVCECVKHCGMWSWKVLSLHIENRVPISYCVILYH